MGKKGDVKEFISGIGRSGYAFTHKSVKTDVISIGNFVSGKIV